MESDFQTRLHADTLEYFGDGAGFLDSVGFGRPQLLL